MLLFIVRTESTKLDMAKLKFHSSNFLFSVCLVVDAWI